MTYTILIVEDEDDIREDICTILELEGYTAWNAANGKEGLRQLQQGQPDIIFSDIFMPEMDGYEFLRNLRADDRYAVIPFIFISAKTLLEDIQKGLDYGANDYITKPFTSQELLNTISKWLDASMPDSH